MLKYSFNHVYTSMLVACVLLAAHCSSLTVNAASASSTWLLCECCMSNSAPLYYSQNSTHIKLLCVIAVCTCVQDSFA